MSPLHPPGVLNDLYMLDATLETPLEWILLDRSSVQGTAPTPRKAMGFAAAGGRLYVFGGDIWISDGWFPKQLFSGYGNAT
jgi:hypothetical protein